jgi:hypothetical protein
MILVLCQLNSKKRNSIKRLSSVSPHRKSEDFFSAKVGHKTSPRTREDCLARRDAGFEKLFVCKNQNFDIILMHIKNNGGS